MAVKIEGVGALTARIDRAGDRSRAKMAKLLRESAEEIRDRARMYAPIDHGNLEEAIEVMEMGGDRDSRGRFEKKSYIVQVDPMARGYHGEPLETYAYVMHEYLTPYGRYKLGPRSDEKDGGRGVVGGRYFERAIDDVEQELMARMIEVVREEF